MTWHNVSFSVNGVLAVNADTEEQAKEKVKYVLEQQRKGIEDTVRTKVNVYV